MHIYILGNDTIGCQMATQSNQEVVNWPHSQHLFQLRKLTEHDHEVWGCLHYIRHYTHENLHEY